MTQKRMPATATFVSSLDGKSLIETVCDREQKQTRFVMSTDAVITTASNYTDGAGQKYVPVPASNTLIATGTVQLPSDVGSSTQHTDLVQRIRVFIHRYMDLSPEFETIATYYVLLSWVHDAFNELPYLRVRGLFGSGKTRFLQVVGSICYRGIFASGASTVAPLFHILHQFGGTLLLDEADFRFTDGNAEIVKVLNNGNAKGMPVLRCVSKNGKTFEATAYKVFGPKIIASRTNFDDPGLESRFLSEDLGRRALRKDIPTSLPPNFHDEATELRNILLRYRFDHFHKFKDRETSFRSDMPRVSQIMQPLLAVCEEEGDQKVILRFATEHAQQLANDLGTTRIAHTLEAIAHCQRTNRDLTIGNITDVFRAKFSDAYDRKITAHWIGYVIRRDVHLKTVRRSGVYYLADHQEDELQGLYERYGIEGIQKS